MNKLASYYNHWASDRPLLLAEWFWWSTLLLDGLIHSRWPLAFVAIVPHIILGKVLFYEED